MDECGPFQAYLKNYRHKGTQQIFAMALSKTSQSSFNGAPCASEPSAKSLTYFTSSSWLFVSASQPLPLFSLSASAIQCVCFVHGLPTAQQLQFVAGINPHQWNLNTQQNPHRRNLDRILILESPSSPSLTPPSAHNPDTLLRVAAARKRPQWEL